MDFVPASVDITDLTASGSSETMIYKILLVIGIIGIVTAASRAKTIATWISGWKK